MKTDAEIVKELMEAFDRTRQAWFELYRDYNGFEQWFTEQINDDKMTPYTETPWEYSGNSEVVGIRQAETFIPVAYVKPANYANARFIVKCCNHHDRLVEALELLLQWGKETPGEFIKVNFSDVIISARQVLAEIKKDGE